MYNEKTIKKKISWEKLECLNEYDSQSMDQLDIEGVISYTNAHVNKPGHPFERLPILTIEWSNDWHTTLQPISYDYILINHMRLSETADIAFSVIRIVDNLDDDSEYSIHDKRCFKKEIKLMKKAYSSLTLSGLLMGKNPMELLFNRVNYKETLIKFIFGVGAMVLDHNAATSNVMGDCTITIPENTIERFIHDWGIYISMGRIPLDPKWMFLGLIDCDGSEFEMQYDQTLDSPYEEYMLDECLEDLSV